MTPVPTTAPSRSLAAATFCTLIWGSTFLFISIGNDTVPPVWAATMRLVAASAILFALAVARGQPLPRGAALASALWFGLFQFGFNFPLLYWAEKTVPSSLTSIVFATIPLQAALMSWRMGLESFSPARVIGGVVAVAGIGFIFGGELRWAGGPWPLLAVVAGTVCANVGSLLYKKGPHQPPIPANAIATALGAVIAFVISRLAREPMTPPPTPGSWFALGYLTIAGSVGAFVTWSWLVMRMPVSRISFIAVIAPLIALALGVLVRHEHLAPLSVAGALVVLAGVAIGLEVGRVPARVAPDDRGGQGPGGGSDTSNSSRASTG
ncbi:MAG: DMT family transporter [Candidatus Eisenbacteria bacterium]